jgi:uncharacterized metal-binding protein YceD (DUF177 family)
MMRHQTDGSTRDSEPRPEFSRVFTVGELGSQGRDISLQASASELEALARRFDLEAIESLSANLDVTPLDGGLIRVRGHFRASVVQTCVISLEPVPALVDERLEAIFAPWDAVAPGERAVVISWEEADPPEPIRGGCIDLGELVAEQLALALDPYPRAPGAELPAAGEAGEAVDNPFQALRRLASRGPAANKKAEG